MTNRNVTVKLDGEVIDFMSVHVPPMPKEIKKPSNFFELPEVRLELIDGTVIYDKAGRVKVEVKFND